MKYPFSKKSFSRKATAILTAAFFIFSGIFVPTSFADGNELILNETQRPVPTLTLAQANAQVAVAQSPLPSGTAVQNASPLSLSDTNSPESFEVTPPVSVITNGDFLQKSSGNSLPDGWTPFWATAESVPGYLSSYDGRTGVVDMSLSRAGRGMKQTYSTPVELNALSMFDITFKVVSATLTGDGWYGIEAPMVLNVTVLRATGATSQVTRFFNYTNDANSAGNANFVLVPQNQWVTRSFTAQELGLVAGDKVTEVDVYSGGWAREAYVDSVNLFLEQVPPVTISLTGVESELLLGTDMTVTATPDRPVDAYRWFLNGELVTGATTSTVTVGRSLAAGIHTLAVETTLGGVATTQSTSFKVIDLAQLAQLDIADQFALAKTAYWADDITDTYVHGAWDPHTGTTRYEYYPIGSSTYAYRNSLQVSRSYDAWAPPADLSGYTHEDRALVEFDLSRWYPLGFDPARIARVELLATVSGSGEVFQGYDFSINSMQALEDGVFSSAEGDFNVGMTSLQTVRSLLLNSTPQDLRFNITDLLRNDLGSGAAWSGIVFKASAANLPVMQLANLRIKVYYDINPPAIPPAQPVVTSNVPTLTNQSTITLSGTKEANTSIWINGAQAVASNGEVVWTTIIPLPAEGNNQINITAKNSSGLVSEAKILTVLRDTVAPAGSVNINSGAASTPSPVVTLNLSGTDSGSGISAMSFSTDNLAWTAAEAYAASKIFTLPSGNGNKTVSVRYYDAVGNVSAVYSKSILLADIQQPMPDSEDLYDGRYNFGQLQGNGITVSQTSPGIYTYHKVRSYSWVGGSVSPAFDGSAYDYVTLEARSIASVSNAFIFEVKNGSSYILRQTVSLQGTGWHTLQFLFPKDTAPVNFIAFSNPTNDFEIRDLRFSDTPLFTGAASVLQTSPKVTHTLSYQLAYTLNGVSFQEALLLKEGNNTVTRTWVNASGKKASYSFSILADTVKPVGSMNINSSAICTASRTVALNLSATDSSSGISAMSFSEDSANWTEPVAYATSKTFTLSAGDGMKTVFVKYYDKAGNASVVYSKSILLDTLPPTGTIDINSGAAYATSTSVTLNLSGADSGSGIAKMSFSTNNTTWTTAATYAATKTFTLPSGDGVKTVYVRYYDKAGNVSAVYSKSIILDTLAPVGTVKVNGGVSYIRQTAVTLDLSASDAGSGLSQMSFSTNGTTWTTAENYAVNKAWTFSAGDGAKKVYVKFQDKAGKWSTAVSVTVTLDTVKPAGSININSGAAYAASPTVILNLSATDARSGISQMSFSTDGTTWTVPAAYATSKTFTLPAGDGTKTVSVKYFDRAGNESVMFSKSIILDTLPPEGMIQVNGGSQFINQTAVTLNLSAADAGSGLSKMSFSTNGTTWTTAENYAATKAWTFTAGDGAKKVYVKFQDKTGKWSAPVSATVLLDTVKPAGALAINNGASTATTSEVTLSLTGSDVGSGVDQVRFSTDYGVHWSEWTGFTETRSFTLPEGNGPRQVQCQLKDKAGLISEVFTDSIVVDIPPTIPWIQAPSNANFAFRVTQDASGYDLELRYIPGGGVTLLYVDAATVPETFDVTPDGSKVIFERDGNAYVQRVGEPWTTLTVQGDLTQILYYNDYVMLKTDHTYPSGTVIRTSTGIRIGTFNPEFISTFYLSLVTPGAGFYRNDALSLAVQPEYDQASGQYYALIYRLYGGNDYSSSVSSASLGQDAPGTAGGTCSLVDAVVAPNGQTVLAIGVESPTFNKTFLVNQHIAFDGAAIAVTYQNNVAIYTVRDSDGSTRTVRFDLENLEIVPELPEIELVQPVITQTPNAANQWTLKLDQAMRGVRYEIQYDTGSGVWQTAGTFIAESYGEVTWQDPAQNRGLVVYRAVPGEITTAADLLTQINMLYLDTDFGLVESTHEYPAEGWLQRRITQPSNFGFYANLLATIAAGDLVTSVISKTEAIRRLDVMMTQLLEDQQTLGYKGLLPWLGYYNGDWQRMDDLYGRQVSFEDNTNMTAGLAVAYGALLDASLSADATVHAAGGILDKIDAFIENQREGYVAMYNESNQTFARTMVIADNRLEGTVDLFGAESMGTLLFLVLQYGDAFPASVYQKLYFSTSDYTMQDGSTRTVVEPFSGAFQMYWPALVLPEAEDPDLRAMLETYTDVQLDYAQRNDQPGLLSASYDVAPYDLLSRYVGAFSWASDVVTGNRGSDGSFHVTSPSSQGIGVYFADDSKYAFEGSTMQIRYSSQTAVPNARLEFKQKIDGVLTTVYVQDLALENTGGEVRTLSLQLPEIGVLGDLSEVVLTTSEGSGPLDLTFYNIDTDRIQYNFSLGINAIAMNGVSETTPSTYNLGAAYMFRPEGVEALLQNLIAEHPELITNHGLWEGLNMTTGKVVKEQVFNNVLSFTLGMAGTGGASMTRYLENKGLMTELRLIWNPQAPVSLTSGTNGNFEWNGFKGTAWHVSEAVRASDRELRITYQSSTPITGVKLDLKHAGSNGPAYSVSFDLPATGSSTGEYVITIPESYLYWYITDAVVLFPEAQGFPNAKITGMLLTPAHDTVPPAVVLDAGTPSLIKTKTLTVSYTADGVKKTKLFEGLMEGGNTLTITETDLAGNQTTVNWDVTVDTLAPVVVLDPETPTWIVSSSIVVGYTLDGVFKLKTFTNLPLGENYLTLLETDLAGNQTAVNFSVRYSSHGTDFLKEQITTFALNGGQAAAAWDSGILHVTSSNFKGVGVAAIMARTSINVRQVQISYSSLTPVPNARIEYKVRDNSGNLIIVKTQYLNLQNTRGAVRTVTPDLLFSGYPPIDEIVFVTDGADASSLDMKFYGFVLF